MKQLREIGRLLDKACRGNIPRNLDRRPATGNFDCCLLVDGTANMALCTGHSAVRTAEPESLKLTQVDLQMCQCVLHSMRSRETGRFTEQKDTVTHGWMEASTPPLTNAFGSVFILNWTLLKRRGDEAEYILAIIITSASSNSRAA